MFYDKSLTPPFPDLQLSKWNTGICKFVRSMRAVVCEPAHINGRHGGRRGESKVEKSPGPSEEWPYGWRVRNRLAVQLNSAGAHERRTCNHHSGCACTPASRSSDGRYPHAEKSRPYWDHSGACLSHRAADGSRTPFPSSPGPLPGSRYQNSPGRGQIGRDRR